MQKHTGIKLSTVQSLPINTLQEISVLLILGGFPAQPFYLLPIIEKKNLALSQIPIFLLPLIRKFATTIVFSSL